MSRDFRRAVRTLQPSLSAPSGASPPFGGNFLPPSIRKPASDAIVDLVKTFFDQTAALRIAGQLSEEETKNRIRIVFALQNSVIQRFSDFAAEEKHFEVIREAVSKAGSQIC
jgi:hypothetical protein